KNNGGEWVNATEEDKAAQKQKEIESSDTIDTGVRDAKRSYLERQGIDSLDASWDEIREQTRREREQRGLIRYRETRLSDNDDDDDEASNFSASLNNNEGDSASAGPEECYTRNYQWKTREEWCKPKVEMVK